MSLNKVYVDFCILLFALFPLEEYIIKMLLFEMCSSAASFKLYSSQPRFKKKPTNQFLRFKHNYIIFYELCYFGSTIDAKE